MKKKIKKISTQDGGNHYSFSDEIANKFAETIGTKLNLKKHSLNNLEDKFIYTPADIEIHKGIDNHYYILDFSRLFPCDYFMKRIKGSIFFRFQFFKQF